MEQQHRLSRLVVQSLFGTVTGKRIAILGFAFKADTKDSREAPAIWICRDLLEERTLLAIHDPKVNEAKIGVDLGRQDGWPLVATPSEAMDGADAVLVLTEWRVYADLDWHPPCGSRPGRSMPAASATTTPAPPVCGYGASVLIRK